MKRYLIGFCSALLVVLTACDTWIDPKINVNPNTPETAAYSVVLPTVQAGMAYVMGGDFGRYTSVLNQQNTGVDRQHLGIYNYQFTESDVNNAWSTMYTGPMNDLAILIERAKADGAPHYQGVFQVLMAYGMITMSDLWGDIPYSEALSGAKNPEPKYDTQESIYTAVNAMLDDAIKNLGAATSNLKPGSDDLMYGGKTASWVKAANSLKARMAIHLVNRSNQAAAGALAAAAAGIASNAEDFQFTFGALETEGNPWYQFTTQRDGDLTFGVKLSEIMMATKDPRGPIFAVADSNSAVSGTSRMNEFYAGIGSAVPFLTYAEMKFIEAEANSRLGNAAAAHAAYVAGITASMQRSGVAPTAITAYLAQPSVDPGSDKLTLDNIMTQKYIAMYTQPESWSDWRRTGFPTLAPTTGTTIPRRFPYAQYERLYNSKMPAGKTINDRVWWDNN
ncbi:MAG: SusD/RagB family nutrient-binding outer membrane lipoprotein [Candidatus Kapabacteria bacterium]|nr:SusD/RagB family nutrient-binding outer membrane lipoprotein [Candidatus Kapabacteria bacterium]